MLQRTMVKKMMGWSVLGFWMVILVCSNIACPSDARISCNEAIFTLLPCQPFLVGFGLGTPSVICCMGAQSVFEEAGTTKTRRDLCKCLKMAPDFGVIPERAEQIPQFCNIHVPVPLDPDVDCTKVP